MVQVWAGQAYLFVGALLLVTSGLARALPITPRLTEDDDGWHSDTPLDPRTVAYLRQGPYGVVLTVLAELHAHGAVDASRPHALRQLRALAHSDFHDPLSTAVYAGSWWCAEARLIALLPSVRRACRPLRMGLVQRGLVTPLRRQAFALTLLGYAVGLAVGTAFEQVAARSSMSTMVGAAGLIGLAVAAVPGPRRTVAGHRVLRAERRLLDTLVDWERSEFLVAAMVATQGRAALEVLCEQYVAVGALARPTMPSRTVRPRLTPARPLVPGIALSPIRLPVRTKLPMARRPVMPAGGVVYEPVSEGPAIAVRPAFASYDQRVAA